MSLMGNISDFSRSSLHDGPGVRTVVYFKGCPLNCLWCHNPETLSAKKQILYTDIKCIFCRKCIKEFPDCHVIENDKVKVLYDKCTGCSKCSELCPTGALSLIGDKMTADEVMAVIKKDKHYFSESGGGVTLSGGECLLQADFCAELLKKCKEEGINTLIETALFVPKENVEKVIGLYSEIYADFKIADSKKHEKYTGQSNEIILENLENITKKAPKKVTVRIPLIPSVNDSDQDVKDFAQNLLPIAENLKGIEILRYNNLSKSKYEQAGMTYTDFGEPQTEKEITRFAKELQNALENKTEVFTRI